MANEEHLEWLREGVEAWNKRRELIPFFPDLSDMVTTQNELMSVNFSSSDLRHAKLNGIDLTNANLSGSELNVAEFKLAILCGANFRNSNVTGAIFDGANVKSDIKSKLYTNLDAHGLTQEQLNSMIGDSGTIIPDHLTRPDHWEVLPWHQEDAGQNDPETVDTFEDASHHAPTEKPREYYQQLALNLTREPIKSAAVLGVYGQQLATAAKMYRDANTVNQLPDDLILVEQIGVMFGALSTLILKQQADSAATIEGLETKIAELEKQLYQLKGELNAVKNSRSEKTPKESGFVATLPTYLAKGFGVTLGTGVAVEILAGAKYIFGDGEDIAQKLVDIFSGLFS